MAQHALYIIHQQQGAYDERTHLRKFPRPRPNRS